MVKTKETNTEKETSVKATTVKLDKHEHTHENDIDCEECCAPMPIDIIDLQGKKHSQITLDDDVFYVMPRVDLISQMVRYQLAKRRAGTASTLTRSDVRGTTKKCKPQKEQGTRHGDKRAPIFRKGGISFGPKPRSYEFKLNKKVKQLALKSILSLKCLQQKLNVFVNFDVSDLKTKTMLENLNKLNYKKVLFVHDDECPAFSKAINNIPHCQFIRTIGLNTYDIMRFDHLALSTAAVNSLTKRLK